MTALLASLERFARRARRERLGARCELCSNDIGEPHAHVVDRSERLILCACGACAVVLANGAHPRFCAVPTRVRVPDPPVTTSELDDLGVPVGLAFLFRASARGRWLAVFPSPAGPTEAELAEDACLRDRELTDDVEALLVRRRRAGSLDAFIVPIDVAYELAGIVRRHWRGIDGGEEATRHVDVFFERLADRAGTRAP